jgi:hypothetical protein
MATVEELFKIAKVPKGNNRASSIESYHEKKYYYEKVYPDGKLPWIDKPFDFINENPLYGKVNLNGDTMVPKSAIINGVSVYKRGANIGGAKEPVFVFDFVAEAFNDLKANIKTLVRTDWLSSVGPIAEFAAAKGMVDLKEISELQKKMHYFVFVSQFLSTGVPKHKEKISNISDFTHFFLKYLKGVTPDIPFTKSGIVNAYYMSPLATGLCVEIDTKGYDDDSAKHEFLTDPNFNIYRIVARRFGFMVDRNVPWRLVADIKSLKMREYMRIVYEKSIIQQRQDAIARWAEAALKSKFPEWPTVEGITNNTYKGVDLTPEEVVARQGQLEKELNGVLVDVANETKAAGLTEEKELYNAKSPVWDNNGVAICTGETFKVCRSRVLKFDKFFEIYYDIPYLDEIREIKKTVYDWYLSYYVQNPVTKKRVLCSEKSGRGRKHIIKETKLKYLSEKEYDKLYNELFWIKMYFDIKLAENNITLKSVEYSKHLKKIKELATLNSGKHKLVGTTTKDDDHTHSYWVDEGLLTKGHGLGPEFVYGGNGYTSYAEHPAGSGNYHNHWIDNWTVGTAKYSFKDWVSGYTPAIEEDKHHVHSIPNSDLPLALAYINKALQKKMKGLKRIYRKEDKEQAIGELLLNASQNGMLPY